MADVEAPRGDCGGLDEFMARLAKDKNKVGRLLGPDDKGNKFVEFPVWFERRGLRTFAVDSGLGKVLCRIPRLTIDVKGDEIPEEQLVPLILSAIVSLPTNWRGEETFALKCGVEIKDGETLPSPQHVYNSSVGKPDALQDQRDYLSCLPKSLPGQVFIALGYMAIAPLPLDPTN